jgi:hypothetical protein
MPAQIVEKKVWQECQLDGKGQRRKCAVKEEVTKHVEMWN